MLVQGNVKSDKNIEQGNGKWKKLILQGIVKLLRPFSRAMDTVLKLHVQGNVKSDMKIQQG